MIRQNARGRRTQSSAQSLVEFAILLPVIILTVFGGIGVNSYIQAQSQLQQAVSRAALTAARDPYDSCMVGDEPTFSHGYQDVVDAFQGALTSPLFPTKPVPTVNCTMEAHAGVQSNNCTASIDCLAGAGNASDGTSYDATCRQTSQPYDKGCFAIWRGGIITVTVKYTVTLPWIPIWNKVTIGASAGAQLEPYREHICPTAPSPQAVSPADC